MWLHTEEQGTSGAQRESKEEDEDETQQGPKKWVEDWMRSPPCGGEKQGLQLPLERKRKKVVQP